MKSSNLYLSIIIILSVSGAIFGQCTITGDFKDGQVVNGVSITDYEMKIAGDGEKSVEINFNSVNRDGYYYRIYTQSMNSSPDRPGFSDEGISLSAGKLKRNVFESAISKKVYAANQWEQRNIALRGGILRLRVIVKNDPGFRVFAKYTIKIADCQSIEPVKTRIENAESFEQIKPLDKNEFIVKGPAPWLDTGIDVRSGCFVILTSTGRVDVSAGWGVHDANGTDNFFVNSNYPVNSTYRYGLAAQITPANTRDKSRDAWIYEYEGIHLAKQTGRLWLVVNDDNPQDNTGEFRVRVSLKCDGDSIVE